MCDLGGMQGGVRAIARDICIASASNLVWVDQGVVVRILHIFAFCFDAISIFVIIPALSSLVSLMSAESEFSLEPPTLSGSICTFITTTFLKDLPAPFPGA